MSTVLVSQPATATTRVRSVGSDSRCGLTAQQRLRFEQLVMEYLDCAYTGALRMTQNPDDAEDLVQDAVLRAMRGFDGFQDHTNFRAWLFRIMTNLYINQYRLKQRRPARADAVEVSGLHSTDASGNPEELVVDRMEAEYLRQAIEELPSDYRTVIMLSDEQGFSYGEIAKIMNCPIGTVRSRLHRARRILGRRLRDYGREAGYLR